MEAALALAARAQEQPQRPRAVVAAQRPHAAATAQGDTAVDALRGVSLEIARGHLTAVMGPSGSGKSTLMHILAGLDRRPPARVQIDGIDITTLKDNDLTKLRRRHIGFVFQFFNLLPMLTAEENITLPLSIAGEKPERGWLEELLEATGLDDRRTHRPAELSGGQQQRVAVARALVSRPTVLFADEPTGNLDSQTSAEILDLLRGAVDTYGQTTVMVTHDPRAATIADRILFLADGVIVKRARPLVAERDPRRAQRGERTMKRVALSGLLGRKLRSTLTAIAIVLGVAMVSGTLVLTDTIEKAFDTIFSSSYEQTDAVVSGKKLVDWSQTGKATGLRGRARDGARAARGARPRPGTILDLSGDADQAKLIDKRRQGDPGRQPDVRLRRRPERDALQPVRARRRATGPPGRTRS